jgi:hypothetical protein
MSRLNGNQQKDPESLPTHTQSSSTLDMALRRLHAQFENFLNRRRILKVIKTRMRQKRYVSTTQAMYL